MSSLELSGVTELSQALGRAEFDIIEGFRNAKYIFLEEGPTIIADVLLEAAAEAGEDAFPYAYIFPMVSAARGILHNVSLDAIEIDFEELGTFDDLYTGYHAGAAIAGGGQVSLPWTGGNSDGGLKNDVELRYEYFRAMKDGRPYQGRGKPIDTTGLWEQTIEERLAVWGDKAPQWLLLQYGQEEWEPTIQAFPIIETIDERLSRLLYNLIDAEVSAAVARFNNSSRSYYNVRDARGRFTKRG